MSAMEYTEKCMTVNEMFDEWRKCVDDPAYAKKYLITKEVEGVLHIDLPNWLKAFEIIQPIYRSEISDYIEPPLSACMSKQRVINQITSDLAVRLETPKP